MQIGKDEMDSYIKDEESAVSDEEAQREPNITVVNIDEIWSCMIKPVRRSVVVVKLPRIKNDKKQSSNAPSQQSSDDSPRELNRVGAEIVRRSEDGGKETKASQEVPTEGSHKNDEEKLGQANNQRQLSAAEIQDMSEKC